MKNWLKINHISIIIGILALFTAAIHLIFSYNLEFHRDELLYFSLGRHPAFGYATVPPMIGWVAWIMQNILKFSFFCQVSCPVKRTMVFLISALAKDGGTGYSRLLAAIIYHYFNFRLRTFLYFSLSIST
jgi:hypothetical protein